MKHRPLTVIALFMILYGDKFWRGNCEEDRNLDVTLKDFCRRLCYFYYVSKIRTERLMIHSKNYNRETKQCCGGFIVNGASSC